MFIKAAIKQDNELVARELLTTVILTWNEEENIGRALEKLRWCEQVIVVDSGSTDKTDEIIQSFSNVKCYQRDFDTHANQWNYGLNLCKSEWILSLDADYMLTHAFIEEIKTLINKDDKAAYYAGFEFYVSGKPVGRNNTKPRAVLFKKERCTYYDEGHTQRLLINGSTGMFKNKILHDDRKPITRWLANQAAYSLKEANMLDSTPNEKLSFIFKLRKTKIFAPFLIFFYCLFIQGLIFKGWRGWHYTLQRTIVEMLVSLRLTEQKINKHITTK